MRFFSASMLLVTACLAALSVTAFAAPPRKVPKPKERHGRDLMVIDGAWQALPDAGDTGVTNGWQSDIPKEAKASSVPSLEDAKPGADAEKPVWRWRRFEIPESWRGQTIRLRFEAVAETAQVWLNGQKLGEHAGGATPFVFNVTPAAHVGASNVLALRIVGGRWGTGIWQGVLLMAHDEAYLGDVFPQTDAQGHVNTMLDLLNTSKTEGDATLDASIVSVREPNRVVQKTHQNLHVTPDRNTTTALMTVGAKQRVLWSLETPVLYLAQLIFRQDKDVLDTEVTTFGFREWGYKAGAITLNGSPLTLKSIALNSARPPVIASVDDAERLRASLRRLKMGGVTVLYLNAPPPLMLKLADEEGLLIVEGARTGQTTQAANDELRALVLRDRAHACLLAWNLGDADTDTATDLRALDSTRFLLVGPPTAPKLWPPNQNAPTADPLPPGLLP